MRVFEHVRCRFTWGLLALGTVASAARADAPHCADTTPTFAYGNAGFAAGYSRWVHGLPAVAPACAVPRPTCGPCWRPCLPHPCAPVSWCGWRDRPSWGWRCYGVTRYACHESVFLSVSPGGAATFFSGCAVPWPVAVPWYPSGWVPVPWQVSANRPATPPLALADKGAPVRMSNADARRRSNALIEVGDRHLRDAVVERRKLSAALSAYRRAATIAPDLPEPLIRQAIVMVALGRQDDVVETVAAVAAIDPRLADSVADRGLLACREIWHGEDPAQEQARVNWIADRWTERWHPEMARVAAAAAASP